MDEWTANQKVPYGNRKPGPVHAPYECTQNWALFEGIATIIKNQRYNILI
jgi:hypothetical protein